MAMIHHERSTEQILRPILFCIMAGCIVLALVSLIELFVPSWDGTFLIVFCVLTAAEAHITFRLFRRESIYRFDSNRILAIELAALYAALQLCIDLIDGHAPFQNYFPHLDGKTLGLYGIVFLTWLLSTDTARDLDRLGRPAEGMFGFAPAERRLSTRFFAGGIVLFIVSGLTQVRVAEAIKLPTPSVSGPIGNVLVYFLLGMLFLGHVHYAALRGRWQRGDIAVAHGFGGRWGRNSVVFVGIVAVVAFLLPTSHTLGLLDVGRAIWDPISTVLIQIILTVRGPLTWLLRLFGGNAPVARPRILPPNLPRHVHLPPQHLSKPARGAGGGLTLLKSLLFWAVVAMVVVYLLRTVTLRRASRIPLLGGVIQAVRGALVQAWAAFRSRLRGVVATMVEHVPGARAVLRVAPSFVPSGKLPFRRISHLPPREQVLYYYLSVVHRARRHGIHRTGSQTPYEFSDELATHLSEAQGDMAALTTAFVEARYSHHAIPEEELGRIRVSWQQVKAALRRVRQGTDLQR